MSTTNDRGIIGELARAVGEIAADPAMEDRRRRWRTHNEFEEAGVPIYIRAVGDAETIEPQCECENATYRSWERMLRRLILQRTLEDDYVIEPWMRIDAVKVFPPDGEWGVPLRRGVHNRETGAFSIDPPLKTEEDIERMVVPAHRIDESATAELVEQLSEAVDGHMEVCVSRKPHWSVWHADISTDLGYLRGIEQIMWDMMDRPEWMHRLLSFMSEGVLKAQEEAERAGDWQLIDHENQSMPYAASLADPAPGGGSMKRKDLWGFFASQETGTVSPPMFDEFMLSYQLPVMEHFALVSYGCCENLTAKIPLLRRIPNLRRIAVTPFADVKACAEQIGSDYICSWRPNPSDMVAYGHDEERIRRAVRAARDVFRANGCRFDVCLKDVQTVQHEPERLKTFVRVVREETGG